MAPAEVGWDGSIVVGRSAVEVAYGTVRSFGGGRLGLEVLGIV